MKREYVRPMMVAERFAANEYVAACGDPDVKLEFVCNEDPGIVGIVYKENDEVLSYSFSACGTANPHLLTYEEVENLERGYVIRHVSGSGQLVSKVPVYIWRGENNDNVHCSSLTKQIVGFINRS